MPIEGRGAKKNPAVQKGAAGIPPPPPPPMPKASVQKTRSGRSLEGQPISAPLSGARKSRDVRPRDNFKMSLQHLLKPATNTESHRVSLKENFL